MVNEISENKHAEAVGDRTRNGVIFRAMVFNVMQVDACRLMWLGKTISMMLLARHADTYQRC